MSDEQDMKAAGHSPAVKVGGARVVQKKPHRDSEGDKDKEAAAVESTQPVGMFSASPVKLNVTAGQLQMEPATREFPTEAVKHMHEKPKPTHEAPRPSQHQHHHIQQPRKQ